MYVANLDSSALNRMCARWLQLHEEDPSVAYMRIRAGRTSASLATVASAIPVPETIGGAAEVIAQLIGDELQDHPQVRGELMMSGGTTPTLRVVARREEQPDEALASSRAPVADAGAQVIQEMRRGWVDVSGAYLQLASENRRLTAELGDTRADLARAEVVVQMLPLIGRSPAEEAMSTLLDQHGDTLIATLGGLAATAMAGGRSAAAPTGDAHQVEPEEGDPIGTAIARAIDAGEELGAILDAGATLTMQQAMRLAPLAALGTKVQAAVASPG